MLATLRVGSTNLNPASWLSNCELDVIVEDEKFAHLMETMYIQDLANATEIILNKRPAARDAAGGPIGRRREAGAALDGQPRGCFASATP
jgi:cardiolipin synthase